MGKAKKRSINLGKYNQISNLSREDAIQTVVDSFKNKNGIKLDLISLFGLTAEELLEGGAQYEDILRLGSLIK